MQEKRTKRIIKKKRDLSPLYLKTKSETKNKDNKNPRLLLPKSKDVEKNMNAKNNGKNIKGRGII